MAEPRIRRAPADAGPAPDTGAAPRGAQVLDRAVALLHLLGGSGAEGIRLGELADRTGLNEPTCHRILASLVHHGLAERLPGGRAYRLGLELFALGARAADGPGLRRLCRPALRRLAMDTGATSFLMMRRGFDSLCVDRQDGGHFIQTLTGDIGGTVPLGIGPGSQAMLAFYPDAEIAEVLDRNTPHYARYGGRARIEWHLQQTRARGYAFDDDEMFPAISGLAVPLRTRDQEVVASLGVGLLTAALRAAAPDRLVALLQAESAAISPVINPLDRRLHRPMRLLAAADDEI
jgi:DNA-binding IclR family transcriptional regulator